MSAPPPPTSVSQGSASGSSAHSWEWLLDQLGQFCQVVGAAESVDVERWHVQQVEHALSWATHAQQLSMLVDGCDAADVDDGLRHRQLHAQKCNLVLTSQPLSVKRLRTSSHEMLLRALLLNHSTPLEVYQATLLCALRLRGDPGSRGDGALSGEGSPTAGCTLGGDDARADGEDARPHGSSVDLICRALLPSVRSTAQLRLAQAAMLRVERLSPSAAAAGDAGRRHVETLAGSIVRTSELAPQAAVSASVAGALWSSASPMVVHPTGEETGVSAVTLAALLQRTWQEEWTAAHLPKLPHQQESENVSAQVFSLEGRCEAFFSASRCESALFSECACWLVLGSGERVSTPTPTPLQRAALKVLHRTATANPALLFGLELQLLALVCDAELRWEPPGERRTPPSALVNLYCAHIHRAVLELLPVGNGASVKTLDMSDPRALGRWRNCCARYDSMLKLSSALRQAVATRLCMDLDSCDDEQQARMRALHRHFAWWPNPARLIDLSTAL